MCTSSSSMVEGPTHRCEYYGPICLLVYRVQMTTQCATEARCVKSLTDSDIFERPHAFLFQCPSISRAITKPTSMAWVLGVCPVMWARMSKF